MGRNIKQTIRRRTQNWQRFTFGFCRYRTEHLKFKDETQTTTTTKNKTNSLSSKTFWFKPKRKRQLRGSLNRYGFVYAHRDKVNPAAKAVPGVIKAATNDINNIAEKRRNQIISKGSKEIEHVLPKILRGATEDVYQTPFRFLGEFGKKKFNSFKTKILK